MGLMMFVLSGSSLCSNGSTRFGKSPFVYKTNEHFYSSVKKLFASKNLNFLKVKW